MDAFEEFVRSRADGLVRLGLALTGRQQDAEDLAQETLLKVHQNWAKVQAARSPDAYVRKIAVNLYTSQKRRWEPRLVTLESAGAMSPSEPSSDDERGLRPLVA
jgi:DNA-directed RNA polymerase specialized sigma24 family protein